MKLASGMTPRSSTGYLWVFKGGMNTNLADRGDFITSNVPKYAQKMHILSPFWRVRVSTSRTISHRRLDGLPFKIARMIFHSTVSRPAKGIYFIRSNLGAMGG